MTPKRKQVVAAVAVTSLNIGVAVSVNLLTSSWSWLIFLVLAVLSASWIGLEAWRAMPKRAGGASHGPPAPPGTTGSFIARPEITGRIVRSLVAGKARKVGITTVLAGAGGFGKTTLAAEVYERPEVTAAFGWRDWVTVGQEVHGAALADAINDISERIDGQRPGLTSPEQAGIHLGELLKQKGRSLLVVDDVWTPEQLRPFRNAGRGCTLLVTTRMPDLLPDFLPIPVDQMSRHQARELLTAGVAELPGPVGEQLLDITGRWPLALGLANAALRRAVRDGADVTEAAQRLLRRLQDLGPTALDVTSAARRDRAVAATLESSLGVLGDRRDRVVELAVFPEDTDIPVDLVVLFWERSANLSPEEGDRLCQELVELSLVLRNKGTLRLHDVIRAYLRHECGDARLAELHSIFLDAVASTLPDPAGHPVRWWTLPPSAEYLWRTLAYHLDGTGRKTELSALVTAPRWVTGKLRGFGPVAVAEDLALVNTDTSRELSRFLDQSGHLLTPTTPEHSVVNAFVQRLPPSPALDGLRRAAEEELAGLARLVPLRVMPDLPDPALNRVLEGHDDRVTGCVFAPDGSWLASAATDGLRVWHPESGRLIRLVADAAAGYSGIALSPDGRILAIEGTDYKTIQLWDTTDWQVRHVLRGHRNTVNCFSFLHDGRTLVSAGEDRTIRAWNVENGRQIRSVKTPKVIDACAGRLDGTILSIDYDGVKIWNLLSEGHTNLTGRDSSPREITVSPDQRWAVAPGPDGLLICDLTQDDEPPVTLHHHADLTTAAFSPDSNIVATAGTSGLIVLWRVADWRPCGQIAAPSLVQQLAWAPDGSVLASAGADQTVRLWNPALARTDAKDDRVVRDRTRACVAAPDGSWLAVAKSSSITIYDPTTESIRAQFDHPSTVYRLRMLGDGSLAAELMRKIALRAADDWQTSRMLQPPTDSIINDLSTGGPFVCCTDADDQLMIWNTETWQPPVFLEADESGVRRRDEPVVGSTKIIDRFRQRLGQRLRRRLKRPTDQWLEPVLRWLDRRLDRLFGTAAKRRGGVVAELAPGGAWVSVEVGEKIHIIATKTWAKVTTLSFDRLVSGHRPVRNGRWLSVRLRGGIQYWNTASWTKEAEFADNDQVADATDGAWSPDGSLLATVSNDRKLRIHDSRSGACLAEIRLDGELEGCAWLTDDRLVAVGGYGVYWFTYLPGDRSTNSAEHAQEPALKGR